MLASGKYDIYVAQVVRNPGGLSLMKSSSLATHQQTHTRCSPLLLLQWNTLDRRWEHVAQATRRKKS